ncbi:MAG TPA: hypothetical protein VF690_15840 [Hymenobacter sp.]|jgi:hypothetical protein
MGKLTAESQARLTSRITDLVQREVREEAALVQRMQRASIVGGQLPVPPELLVSFRAQLAALRWIQASESTPAAWRNRWRAVERHAAAVEQLKDQLTHAGDEVSYDHAHDLLLCLHGQSLILEWAWFQLDVAASLSES